MLTLSTRQPHHVCWLFNSTYHPCILRMIENVAWSDEKDWVTGHRSRSYLLLLQHLYDVNKFYNIYTGVILFSEKRRHIIAGPSRTPFSRLYRWRLSSMIYAGFCGFICALPQKQLLKFLITRSKIR